MNPPEWEISDAGLYLWVWFFEILEGFRSIDDGVPVRIPWTEYDAWARVTGNIVTPDEYAILRQMSSAWCKAMGEELANNRAIEASANPPPKTRTPKG